MTTIEHYGATTRASASAVRAPEVSRTKTSAELIAEVDAIAHAAGAARNESQLLGQDVEGVHQRALRRQLQARAAELSRRDPTELLAWLVDLGFSWRDIAHLLGVTVPAVRKWRQGQVPTGEDRGGLSSLVALCQVLSEHHLIYEVASWMEVPIASACPLTPMDLYAARRQDLLLDYATGHISPEVLLDRVSPNWRERYRSNFEVFAAPDGELGTRPRGNE